LRFDHAKESHVVSSRFSVIPSLSNGHLLGDEHPDTVSSMSNLALTLGDWGKLGEAAAAKRDVLEKR
jgi:hypothetical protein